MRWLWKNHRARKRWHRWAFSVNASSGEVVFRKKLGIYFGGIADLDDVDFG